MYPAIGLGHICRLLGVTRQAFYKHFRYISDQCTEEQLLLEEISNIRRIHPVMGGRKLYYLLQPFLLEHQIKMGRDALFDLLAINKMLIRKRKRKVSTTQSHHWLRKYPNLIKNRPPSKPNQLWVSDITYVPIPHGFLYLSLLTDAYSHKIMGHALAENLESIHTIRALKMALNNLSQVPDNLIHHSDRGVQYCSTEYVSLLTQNNIQISMSETGDPLDNAVAERINGILKEEYLSHYPISNLNEAMELVTDVINRYNRLRPHLSINLLTPHQAHQMPSTNKNWRRKRKSLNIVNRSQD